VRRALRTLLLRRSDRFECLCQWSISLSTHTYIHTRGSSFLRQESRQFTTLACPNPYPNVGHDVSIPDQHHLLSYTIWVLCHTLSFSSSRLHSIVALWSSQALLASLSGNATIVGIDQPRSSKSSFTTTTQESTHCSRFIRLIFNRLFVIPIPQNDM
jgi:hypothetical protein